MVPAIDICQIVHKIYFIRVWVWQKRRQCQKSTWSKRTSNLVMTKLFKDIVFALSITKSIDKMQKNPIQHKHIKSYASQTYQKYKGTLSITISIEKYPGQYIQNLNKRCPTKTTPNTKILNAPIASLIKWVSKGSMLLPLKTGARRFPALLHDI